MTTLPLTDEERSAAVALMRRGADALERKDDEEAARCSDGIVEIMTAVAERVLLERSPHASA